MAKMLTRVFSTFLLFSLCICVQAQQTKHNNNTKQKQPGANDMLPAAADSTWLTPFEKSKGEQSATFAQCCAFYKKLDLASEKIQFDDYMGVPFVLVKDAGAKKGDKPLVIMINNGIHPGEPDGIDATMMLLRDIHLGKVNLPAGIALRIIPFYNVSGGLRRGDPVRVNQDGPAEYGFRGNAKNLDLNRDFIKCDALETRAFRELFTADKVTPDIFIDTHVSNGADYQYTMTLLATQHNQLGHIAGAYQHDTLVPALYGLMKKAGHDMVPYVNHFGDTPDSGWVEFFDSPRFSSGYASLFSTFSILPETHMLKPFPQRVQATYDLLKCVLEFSAANKTAIQQCRARQLEADSKTKAMPVAWELDSSKLSWINFKGYEAGYKPSSVSGHKRLFYDRNKPYTREVKFYDTFKSKQTVEVPEAYLVPAGYVELLQNMFTGCALKPELLAARDTVLFAEVYTIDSFKTVNKPYEGHYLHYNTQVHVTRRQVHIPGGTYYIVPVKSSAAARFLVNVLEPVATDSYFNWNFFDGILQQKEGYSDYVFEDIAASYLDQHPELRQELEKLKQSDKAFAASGAAQLDWVYKHSPYYEGTVNQYPVYRIVR